MSWMQRVRAYAAHEDPLTAASNTIALLIASNQPFYPLYVWYLIGGDAAVASLWTWLSTPFFLAVPFLARRNSLAGRALMVIAGAGNTFMCAKIFGAASAVELFLAPCAMLAALSFRKREYAATLTLLGGGFALFALLQGRYGAPLMDLTEAQIRSFVALHVYSVAALVAFIGWTFAGATEEGSTKQGI